MFINVNKKNLIGVLLMICLSSQAFGQNVTVNIKNAPISSVLTKIQKQYGYSFAVKSNDLDLAKVVSVNAKNQSLVSVIQDAFNSVGQKVDVSVEGKTIVISSKKSSNLIKANEEINIVKGKITDSGTGEPVIGASIIQKGTRNGVVTNINGDFQISVPLGTILEISSLGYKDVEAIAESILNISLHEDINLIDEVLVIGYGSVKKSDLTGSVSSIKASSFESRPAATVDGLLQGKIAGMQVTQSSGEPGASLDIHLRGISSRQGSNAPLYVVDGFPYGYAGALKQVNVNDIASIEVLKDASAASIYGSRGANGVILITTKSGMNDKTPIFSLSTNTGVQWVNTSNYAIIKDPFIYAMLSDEARINDTRIGVPKYIGAYDDAGFYYPSLIELQSGIWDKTTDWEKAVLKPAAIQDYNLSVSGGGKNNSYMVSASYFNQDGVLIGSSYERFTTRLKFDQKIGDKFKFGTNMSFSYVNRQVSNISYDALFRNPVFPVYDDDGSYYKEDPTDMTNPVMLANEVTNHSDGYDVYMMAFADWTICKGLTLRAQSGLKLGASISDKYYPRTTTEGDIHDGRAFIDNYLGTYLLNEVYATYKREFGGKHGFSAMFGYTGELTRNQGSSLTAEGFANDNLKSENLSMGNPEKNLVSNYMQREALNSFLSRINYTYDNRYLFTFTGRFDGSSKFGKNNRYGFFPSVAAGWKISEEPFVKGNVNWLDELKLRVSYGSTGNQAISIYGTKDKIGGELNDKYYVGNTLVSGLGLIQMGNDGLKWETTRQANVGLDFGAFKNALTLSIDLYNKKTTDLLRQRNLPLSGGIGSHHNGSVGSVWVNSGELNNRGVEITLNARPISQKDFTWTLNATASHNKTLIVDIGEEGESMGLLRSRGNFKDGGVYWRNGQPMDIIVGYRVDGIIQTGETIDYLSRDEALAGEFKYRDTNGDGALSSDDMEIIGCAQPKCILGFGSTFTYKGFVLDLQFNGILGKTIISEKRFSNAKQINRWTTDNPTQLYPSLRNGRNLRMCDWWLEDGSYLRISNITFGYTFNTDQLKYIDNLHISANCANPYVFTKFSGADPEVSIFDSGTYPKPSTFSLAIKLDF